MKFRRAPANGLGRRAFLTGAGAMLAQPLAAIPAGAAPSWDYDFEVYALGAPVGHHRVSVRRADGLTHVHVDIDVRLSLLLLGVFEYRRRVDEVWRGDRLLRLRALTHNGKRDDVVEVARTDDDRLAIESARLGPIVLPGDVWPESTVWNHDSVHHRGGFLDLNRGRLRPMEIELLGYESISVLGRHRMAQRYVVHARRKVEVLYGLDGDWLGVEWSRYGVNVRYHRRA